MRAIQITEDAIDTSIVTDSIVTLRADDEVEFALLAACEDYAENGEVTEYWGIEDGSAWRVHVRA